MKNWELEEFIAECEELCRNQYTYNYDNMPEGICNGHQVGPYMHSWHSIVIDGTICNMACINEKWPNGFGVYVVGDQRMTALEYVRYRLNQ